MPGVRRCWRLEKWTSCRVPSGSSSKDLKNSELEVMAETMARADLPRLPTALPTLLAASARTRSEPTQLEAKDVKAEAGPPEGPLGEQPSETLGLTKERAITLQLELMAAYGTPAFQKQLHEIGRRHGTLGVQSSLRGVC